MSGRQHALNYHRLGLTAPGYETTSRSIQPTACRPQRPQPATPGADRSLATAHLELRRRQLQLINLGR